ncbi:MAG TPA: HAMP domain-containing sensor histidine kinase [Ktedonobacteraceae bacterium]
MYFPLQLRLTLFYAILLGLALWIFGNIVYTQAETRAYNDLDATLSSRAAGVRIGKDLLNQDSHAFPLSLPGIDQLGTGGVSIEILDSQLHLLATTSSNGNAPFQTGVNGFGNSPVPWDKQAARWILEHPFTEDGNANSIYSTITYQGQHVRVYTLVNPDFGSGHIIQTARSEQDIEQSLADLRLLLWRGGALVMILALIGGWLITWTVLTTVRRMTKTAHSISASQDFSKRVPDKSLLGKDELATLAATFNEMLAKLEAAYVRQQRFVADASHELRAPITSIRCNLDLLASAQNLPPQEAEAALTDARAEADRMGRLVNDLLTLARSDAASKQIADYGYRKANHWMHKFDLDSLLLEVFRQYKPSAANGNESNGRDFEKQPGPRLMLLDIMPLKVYGDPDRLKQVLVALLDNALKYTPFEGSVALSLTTGDYYALIKVSDTGIGIQPEDLPHIFERFYRADPARSRDRGGSGLGLTIAQSIMHEHEGSIEVESTPGKGSIFIMKLPLAREDD